MKLSEKAEQYVYLKMRAKELEKDKKEVDELIRRKETELLASFLDEGVNGIAVNIGGNNVTLKPSKRFRAKVKQGVDRMDAALVLVQSGLGYLVKNDFNLNSLSSEFGQIEERGDAIPEEVKGVFDIDWMPSISVRGIRVE